MEERNLKLVADNNPRKSHLLLLLVALVVIIGLGIYFLLTDFSIQKVEIKGNDTYTNTEILDAMKEDGYVNNTLLMIAQNQIFGQTYLPFIDKISMSYDDSHILKVRVKAAGRRFSIYESICLLQRKWNCDGEQEYPF